MTLNQRRVIENPSNKVTQPKQRQKKFNVLPIAGKKKKLYERIEEISLRVKSQSEKEIEDSFEF